MNKEDIEIGFQTFVADGDAAFGAVRDLLPGGRRELVIYIENAGDFNVPLDAVSAVHEHKVILDYDQLEAPVRDAIAHAHDAETRPLRV